MVDDSRIVGTGPAAVTLVGLEARTATDIVELAVPEDVPSLLDALRGTGGAHGPHLWRPAAKPDRWLISAVVDGVRRNTAWRFMTVHDATAEWVETARLREELRRGEALADFAAQALRTADGATLRDLATTCIESVLGEDRCVMRIGTEVPADRSIGVPVPCELAAPCQLVVYGACHRRPDGDDVAFVTSVAAALAPALDRAAGQDGHLGPPRDELTGLASRRLLDRRLAAALGPDGAGAAIVFCDLDRFKVVNDRFGHRAGDLVLVEVARRLRGAIRPLDTVARVGGDEFCVLCPAAAVEEAETVSERIVAALERPVLLPGGRCATVSMSVGFALAAPGSDPSELLDAADGAMYRSKRSDVEPISYLDSPFSAAG
ncbi:MAG: GGDEF domain-containing protein [Actinomycetota bacterium]|nr:GGDEF domain-containing protein [Actinomycetota bacterium]